MNGGWRRTRCRRRVLCVMTDRFVPHGAKCMCVCMCVIRAEHSAMQSRKAPVCHSYRAQRHTEQSACVCAEHSAPCVIRAEHSAMQSKVHVCHSCRAQRHAELESARVSFVQSKAPCRQSAMQSKVHVCVQSKAQWCTRPWAPSSGSPPCAIRATAISALGHQIR